MPSVVCFNGQKNKEFFCWLLTVRAALLTMRLGTLLPHGYYVLILIAFRLWMNLDSWVKNMLLMKNVLGRFTTPSVVRGILKDCGKVNLAL